MAAIDERGPDRFAAAARRWGRWPSAPPAHAARPARQPPVAVGGFAFASDGGVAPHWAGYEPASLHVPEAAMARRGDEVGSTLAALARPDDVPDEIVARLEARAAELHERLLPLLDPDPPGGSRSSAMPPEHYEAAVARAVERIRRRAWTWTSRASTILSRAPARMRSTARATAAS